MKIGILTHHYVKNFGAYMQAFGLISIIRERFQETQVEFIDFRVRQHEFATSKHFFGYKPNRRDTFKGFFSKIELFFTHKKYEKALLKSKRVFSATEIDALKYDLIIVGSDEVWNFNDIAFDPVKFGIGISTPMITYSASVGGSSVEDQIDDEIVEGIKNFRAIAARDEKTEQLVSELTGRIAVRTLDPVYLFDYKLVCSEKIKKISKEKPYILIYDCHLQEKQAQALMAFAKANNMNIYGAGEYRNWYSSIETSNITPFEWAYLFKHAWGVITGTFHGTSFAIKYNRRFVAYLTEQNRINKVGSMLSDFRLQSQIILNGQEEMLISTLQKRIDYSSVNQIIKNKVTQSLDYLYQEINKISED